jgi:hypothetical protein
MSFAKHIASGIATPAKMAVGAVKGLVGKVGDLFRLFKKRAMYRAMNTVISSITKGFSEGTKHVYEYSKAVGTALAPSLDKLATSGLYLKNNMVVIAKGGEHLRVFHDKEGYFVTSEAGVRVSGHCPSVNVLFDSVAYCGKNKAVGVILTGMGADGATGLLNMKKMGSYTIGQDEASSVVYGMPRAAFENGSVRRQIPAASAESRSCPAQSSAAAAAVRSARTRCFAAPAGKRSYPRQNRKRPVRSQLRLIGARFIRRQ